MCVRQDDKTGTLVDKMSPYVAISNLTRHDVASWSYRYVLTITNALKEAIEQGTRKQIFPRRRRRTGQDQKFDRSEQRNIVLWQSLHIGFM
jgi:hypothetical protein